MGAVFDLRDVTVVRSARTLINHVSWRVEEGQHWVILGPNGAGKTTLMQILGAELHPSSGSAEVLGAELGTVDVFDLRTRIGHTSTTVADKIPADETVRDTVLSAAYAVHGRWRERYDSVDDERADSLLGELGIAELRDRTFGTLSEGEKKRVLITRALMTDPEVLLLDEPASGLDLGAREDLLASLELLTTEPAGPVLVMVSHHVEEIATGFTHVLLLRHGAVVAAGPIAETMTSEHLSAAFGQKLEVFNNGGRYSARRMPAAHEGRILRPSE